MPMFGYADMDSRSQTCQQNARPGAPARSALDELAASQLLDALARQGPLAS